MSQKNETLSLILALLITLGLLGVGAWWVMKNPKIQAMFNPGSPANPGSSPPPAKSLPSAPIPKANNTQNNSTQNNNAQNFKTVSNVPAGVFSYGGSTTWAPLRKDVDSLIQQALPQFKLRYTDHPTQDPGSGTGIEMLIDNQLTFAQSSRSLKEKEHQDAKQRGFTLKEIPVAIDGLAIAVNPALNVPGLTTAQLKEIYTGKIFNWSQVGGPDLPIQPYSRRPEDGGTVEFFVDNILGGEPLGPSIVFIPNTTQALRSVSEDPGGIYYASAPEVVGQCTVKTLPIGLKADQLVPPYQEPLIPTEACPDQRNQLNASGFQTGAYPITRRLFVIVKRNGQVDQQAGEAYAELLLTEQGQDLIEQTGFVRLR